MQDLLSAIALVFVIEGILPFVSPGTLRQSLGMIARMGDNTLRAIGLALMLVGLGLLSLVR